MEVKTMEGKTRNRPHPPVPHIGKVYPRIGRSQMSKERIIGTAPIDIEQF